MGRRQGYQRATGDRVRQPREGGPQQFCHPIGCWVQGGRLEEGRGRVKSKAKPPCPLLTAGAWLPPGVGWRQAGPERSVWTVRFENWRGFCGSHCRPGSWRASHGDSERSVLSPQEHGSLHGPEVLCSKVVCKVNLEIWKEGGDPRTVREGGEPSKKQDALGKPGRGRRAGGQTVVHHFRGLES